MFGSINELAHRLDSKVRLLTPADQESLFEVLDVDNSKSISFEEAALAVSRCEADPFLKDAAGFVLANATRELAQGLMEVQAKASGDPTMSALAGGSEVRSRSARMRAHEARDIISSSLNVPTAGLSDDEGVGAGAGAGANVGGGRGSTDAKQE